MQGENSNSAGGTGIMDGLHLQLGAVVVEPAFGEMVFVELQFLIDFDGERG
jgi:hypothetical protein